MAQIVSILTIAIIFTGLSIQIARFHSQSRRGAYSRDKNTVQKLWLKMGEGLTQGGEYMGGILRSSFCFSRAIHPK